MRPRGSGADTWRAGFCVCVCGQRPLVRPGETRQSQACGHGTGRPVSVLAPPAVWLLVPSRLISGRGLFIAARVSPALRALALGREALANGWAAFFPYIPVVFHAYVGQMAYSSKAVPRKSPNFHQRICNMMGKGDGKKRKETRDTGWQWAGGAVPLPRTKRPGF